MANEEQQFMTDEEQQRFMRAVAAMKQSMKQYFDRQDLTASARELIEKAQHELDEKPTVTVGKAEFVVIEGSETRFEPKTIWKHIPVDVRQGVEHADATGMDIGEALSVEFEHRHDYETARALLHHLTNQHRVSLRNLDGTTLQRLQDLHHSKH